MEQRSAATTRVLYVRDGPDAAESTATSLEREREQLSVDTATSASEGFERLAKDEFDCVVSGYETPGVNGLELLDAVREEYPNLPFIMYTGGGSEAVASEAIARGVTDYLQTDVDTDQRTVLANRVENAVDSYRTQQDVATQKEQYQQLFEQAPVMYAVTHNRGGKPIVEDCNQQFLASLGHAREDVLGEPLDELYTADSTQALYGGGYNRALSGEFVTEERSFVTADGDEIETLLRAVPRRDATGETIGTLTLYVDITERKRRERELEQERAFIDQALDTLDEVFYVVEMDGTFRRWNDRLTEVTGHSDEELAELNAVDLFCQDDREPVGEAIEETLETGRTAIEAEFLTVDGERIPYEFTGARLTDPDGELIGLVGTGRDVSARKERERQLHTFREAVENAGHSIYWTSDDGTIQYVNPAFEEQTGYSATEAIGETPAIFSSGVQSDDFYADMWETIQAGERWEAEYVNRRKNGERYTVNQSISPVYEDGEINRFVAVAADITEQYQREQQLSVLQRVLRHDLRNNLNEILLATQILRRELDESESTDQLDAIQRTVEETLSLANTFRELQKLFQSEKNHTRELDLAERARTQVSSVQTERQNVDTTVDLPSEAYAATNELIDQAIRNVLQNAIEHNDTDTPEIEVTLERQPNDKEVALCIADNGPGVPQNETGVLESDQEGQLQHLSGIGLWLVNWVVSLSGGDLAFEDNDPRGTVVKLILPAANQADDLS